MGYDLEMTRALAARLFPRLLVGLQEGWRGQILPVYRVRAWRSPNEDGAPHSILCAGAPLLTSRRR